MVIRNNSSLWWSPFVGFSASGHKQNNTKTKDRCDQTNIMTTDNTNTLSLTVSPYILNQNQQNNNDEIPRKQGCVESHRDHGGFTNKEKNSEFCRVSLNFLHSGLSLLLSCLAFAVYHMGQQTSKQTISFFNVGRVGSGSKMFACKHGSNMVREKLST